MSTPEKDSALSKTVVNISDPAIEATGMDAIWHNMDVTNPKAFVTFRKWFDDDANAMIKRIAGHVDMGLYRLISVSVSKHTCVVICTSEKTDEELLGDDFVG